MASGWLPTGATTGTLDHGHFRPGTRKHFKIKYRTTSEDTEERSKRKFNASEGDSFKIKLEPHNSPFQLTRNMYCIANFRFVVHEEVEIRSHLFKIGNHYTRILGVGYYVIGGGR